MMVKIEINEDNTGSYDEIPINVASSLINNSVLLNVDDLEEVANHLLAYVSNRRKRDVYKK